MKRVEPSRLLCSVKNQLEYVHSTRTDIRKTFERFKQAPKSINVTPFKKVKP